MQGSAKIRSGLKIRTDLKNKIAGASGESGASSYASVEEPDKAETSSSKRRKSWASLTPSAVSEDEMRQGSVDLQSHDPRPASVAMLGWAQGLGTVASSLPDEEQPVLTKPLTLNTDEKVMEKSQSIDSTLPIKYNVNETHRDQEFKRPKDKLPAWENRQEFIEKLDGSRLLIVRAPTGSGKTAIYPALAARAIPKRFGRVCCTQVRRATTQGVCNGTKKMWGIHHDNKVVGFQHGLEKSSQWDQEDTRVGYYSLQKG